MQYTYDKNAPKKPTNVTVNSDLLKLAKACGINVSATLEQALVAQVKAASREQWLHENQAAIAAYNEHVEKHGVFSDKAADGTAAGARSF
ncbi:MAG: type II toxin-antitoxin system CcdA family antitoxin [Spongiibacteraceae bacterium]